MSQTFDWTESRLVQFNTSQTLNYILQGLNDMLGVSEAELAANLANVDTASGAQLDVIGKLVGANRAIRFPILNTTEDFGFDDASWYGFDGPGGTFDKKDITDLYILNDEAYRTYIKLKAYSNVSNCSLYSVNYILKQIFAGRGLCYVKVTGPLEVTFTFNFSLTTYERNLLVNRYIPIPAGFTSVIVENA
jgi:hypothetical protein